MESKLTAIQPHHPGHSPGMSDRACNVGSQGHRGSGDELGDGRNIRDKQKPNRWLGLPAGGLGTTAASCLRGHVYSKEYQEKGKEVKSLRH